MSNWKRGMAVSDSSSRKEGDTMEFRRRREESRGVWANREG
jgi:hypothetical protein